jgi:LCP family protein required for cell wall assembly
MSRFFPGGHAQARPSARTKRLQAAIAREERLRRRGVDTGTWREQLASARDASMREDERRASEPVAGTVPIRRVLGVGFLLAVAGVFIAGVLLWQRADAFNRAVSTAPSLSSALLGPLGGPNRINVAFLGYAGREGHGGIHLADSLNILSIDPATNTTTLIAIPRDLWIEGMPDLFPENAKINEGFSVGWDAGGVHQAGRTQADVLEHVTGLPIDHWIALDFDGLAGIVDAVGGVTVENPTAFAYTVNEQNYHNGVFTDGEFPAGQIQLDGESALAYARARYTSVQSEAGDFARSIRQQRVLAGLRAKLGDGLPGSIGPGLALMDVLSTHLATDLSAIDLALLSGHLSADRRLELTEGTILEATTTDDGRYVLVVMGRADGADYAPLHAFIADELAKAIPTPEPSASPAASGGL